MTGKQFSWLCVLPGLLSVTLPSAAAPPGFYAGAGGGLSVAADWLDGDGAGAWKIFGGYRFKPHLGIAADYRRVGRLRFDKAFSNREVDAEISALAAFATLSAPVKRTGEVFLKIGVVRWDADVEITSPSGSTSTNDKGADFAWGVGGQFQLNESLSTRLEIEGFDSGAPIGTVLTLSAGLFWRF